MLEFEIRLRLLRRLFPETKLHRDLESPTEITLAKHSAESPSAVSFPDSKYTVGVS